MEGVCIRPNIKVIPASALSSLSIPSILSTLSKEEGINTTYYRTEEKEECSIRSMQC